MALVYIKDSESKTELWYEVNGQDIMGDMLESTDHWDMVEDGCELYYKLTEAEYDWWERWIEREKRIGAAYETADEQTRKAYEQAIIESGYDLEQTQDALEEVLGIK